MMGSMRAPRCEMHTPFTFHIRTRMALVPSEEGWAISQRVWFGTGCEAGAGWQAHMLAGNSNLPGTRPSW